MIARQVLSSALDPVAPTQKARPQPLFEGGERGRATYLARSPTSHEPLTALRTSPEIREDRQELSPDEPAILVSRDPTPRRAEPSKLQEAPPGNHRVEESTYQTMTTGRCGTAIRRSRPGKDADHSDRFPRRERWPGGSGYYPSAT